MIERVKAVAAENIDRKVVVSTILGAAIMGVAVYFAARSGIKPIATAAKAVSGK